MLCSEPLSQKEIVPLNNRSKGLAILISICLIILLKYFQPNDSVLVTVIRFKYFICEYDVMHSGENIF